MPFDPNRIRDRFPALAITDAGRPRIYFDNPAGTQVPQSVADAVSDCLLKTNANLGGSFASSRDADAVVLAAREAMADFLNAPAADEIVFGQNMTTLTLQLSRAIGRTLSASDEIVVTRMDHDANVWPWVLMARDAGATVRWLPFDTASYEFNLDDLRPLLGERTRLVCVGGASNLTGTVNDVQAVSAMAHDVGALCFVDAVQSAPHLPTDVQAIGCDFLACSAYKFFGPHQGILWGRRECLLELEPYKLRPVPDELPWCFETGTQSHEGMAGTAAAVDYFADVGTSMAAERKADWPQFGGRRQAVHAAMDALFDYEKGLAAQLIAGLESLDGVRVHGITAADAMDRRVPTVSFTHDAVAAADIARRLAAENIFVWSGHNYALELARAIGVAETGGVVRVGPVHYNTSAEIDALLAALGPVLNSKKAALAGGLV